MSIGRSWFAEQAHRLALMSADPSSASEENIEARLRLLETSIASILSRIEKLERN